MSLALAEFVLRPSFAQSPQAGALVLSGARLIDGTGARPIEQSALVIVNGRISSIGSLDSVKIPPGAVRVDVSGKTIIPGLISAHAHANSEAGAALPPRDQLAAQLKLYADYGVTTAYLLDAAPADLPHTIALRDEQERIALDRARVYVSGPSVRAATSIEEARQIANSRADAKVDIVKMHIQGNPKDMTPEVYGALIDEAHKRGLRAAAHLFYLKDAKGLLAAGVDVVAHSVRDQDVDTAFIGELKKRNVGYIPTLTRELSVFVYETTPSFFSDPFFLRGVAAYKKQMTLLSDPALQEKTRNNKEAQAIKDALRQANRNLKLVSDAGITIAMGTDSGAPTGRWQGYFEHVELEMMVGAGLTPMQALVAATSGAARTMKLDQLGTLQPGKWADLVVLNANPLENIRHTREINSVWVAGRKR
jgi:imidazolonepropionase-like amidohydrolase